MEQDELKIRILKREEDRILVEVKSSHKIYIGFLEFNKSNDRIRGVRNKRKLIHSKFEKRVEKQIFKANDTEIVQALKSSLESQLLSRDMSNIEVKTKIVEKLVGKTINTRGRYNSIHRKLIDNNRIILRLTESETGDTLPPIVP